MTRTVWSNPLTLRLETDMCTGLTAEIVALTSQDRDAGWLGLHPDHEESLLKTC